MLRKTPDQISELLEYVTQALGNGTGMGYSSEIGIVNFFNENLNRLSDVSHLIAPSELINFNFLGVNLGLVPTIDTNLLFGPQMAIWLPLMIIPILAVSTTYFSSKIMMPKTDSNAGKGGMAGAQGTMQLIGPLMTLMFSFQLPAGVSMYWTISNLVQMIQQLYINKYVLKKKEVKNTR